MEKRETGRGSERTRFGLLVGTPSDLTDGLETLAALQFLPTVSEILDRYDPHEPSERTYVIANGTLWADTAGTTLADRPNIVPLLVSVGLPRGEDPSNPLVISNEAREYFAANGPIGCRDSTTVDVLAEAGVPAYLSGCLTMTFPEYNGRRSGSFVFVDVAEEVRDSVCRSLGVESMDIRTMTAQMPGLPGGLNRRFVRLRQMAEARRILRLCERSATVVTTHS
ncbi:MAG: hypothetical protein KDB26_12665, partial [Microthrixaceae bacterium]|nr:hypothetical protein [Microthrixaceae bacterium]